MVKCALCPEKISTTFLDKVNGTYIKDESGKKHVVCSECQKKFGSREKILEALK